MATQEPYVSYEEWIKSNSEDDVPKYTLNQLEQKELNDMIRQESRLPPYNPESDRYQAYLKEIECKQDKDDKDKQESNNNSVNFDATGISQNNMNVIPEKPNAVSSFTGNNPHNIFHSHDNNLMQKSANQYLPSAPLPEPNNNNNQQHDWYVAHLLSRAPKPPTNDPTPLKTKHDNTNTNSDDLESNQQQNKCKAMMH